MKNGDIPSGLPGSQILNVDAEVAKELKVKENVGVLITRVFQDSPGEKAGLKPGDVVTAIAGKPVRGGTDSKGRSSLWGWASRWKCC